MQAIILAAGAGTRVGMNIPKCLIEINGATLLKNQIETLHRLFKMRGTNRTDGRNSVFGDQWKVL